MTIHGPFLCVACKHNQGIETTPELAGRCAAFPDGIPAEILVGADHRAHAATRSTASRSRSSRATRRSWKPTTRGSELDDHIVRAGCVKVGCLLVTAKTKTITLTEPDALGAVRWELTYVNDAGELVDELEADRFIGEGYNADGERVAGIHGVPEL